MVNGQLAPPADLSGRSGGPARSGDLTDRQLLERFVRHNDETAFSTLVRRHGPMVLGVCRRVLHHAQDAEDAFQATFLVLVRKGRSLDRPELLANWLYGVAYRTARHARAKALRRDRREREAASMSAAWSDPETLWQDLREVLDEELHRLPEKYRAPLVLCYLEGKTNEEAARLLGWPAGSMSCRLARGRDMLRDRLTGRTRGWPAALSAPLLERHLEPAAVPPFLAETTVQAALALLGAKTLTAGLVSASVSDLMDATLRTLAASRQRWLLSGLLAAAIAVGLAAAAYTASDGWPPRGNPAPATQHPAGSNGHGCGCDAHRTE